MTVFQDRDREVGIERLREIIERALNHKLVTPKDFEMLSKKIFEQQKQTISTTTLKRIWNYLKNEQVKARETTLDILTQFVGYKNWEYFLEYSNQNEKIDNEKLIFCTPILPESLHCGQQLQIHWHNHCYCIVKYIGNKKFKVLKSYNSILKENDRFECHFMLNYEPIYLFNIQHGTNQINALVIGNNGGVCISPYKGGSCRNLQEIDIWHDTENII